MGLEGPDRVESAPAGECCGGVDGRFDGEHPGWVAGAVCTPAGRVPVVRTEFSWRDRLGAAAVRAGLRRMSYRVPPGLYAVGEPDGDSEVFVSANYKLSFDHLRRALGGRNGWVLVLDTRGVNVWCAAGKGTFGTDELVQRVERTGLAELVEHRRLVVPQLGATGVSAHEVRRRCGFGVVYGPVRADDLPQFLDRGMEATPAMRRVTFGLPERAVLVPVEVVTGLKAFAGLAVVLALLAGLGTDGWSGARALTDGMRAVLIASLGFLAGTAATPVLLPWLPGRSFSLKGTFAGLAAAVGYAVYRLASGNAAASALSTGAWLLILPAVAAYYAMNFTGASTFTSLSGVRREMRVAVPLQAGGLLAGLVLWGAGRML